MWTRSTLSRAQEPDVGKSAVSERFSNILREIDRHGVIHEIGDGVLSIPQGRGMGRAAGVELSELVDELREEPLAGAFEADPRCSASPRLLRTC